MLAESSIFPFLVFLVFALIWAAAAIAAQKKKQQGKPRRSWEEILREWAGEPRPQQPRQPPPLQQPPPLPPQAQRPAPQPQRRRPIPKKPARRAAPTAPTEEVVQLVAAPAERAPADPHHRGAQMATAPAMLAADRTAPMAADLKTLLHGKSLRRQIIASEILQRPVSLRSIQDLPRGT